MSQYLGPRKEQVSDPIIFLLALTSSSPIASPLTSPTQGPLSLMPRVPHRGCLRTRTRPAEGLAQGVPSGGNIYVVCDGGGGLAAPPGPAAGVRGDGPTVLAVTRLLLTNLLAAIRTISSFFFIFSFLSPFVMKIQRVASGSPFLPISVRTSPSRHPFAFQGSSLFVKVNQ